MTPLATQVATQLTLPLSKRTMMDSGKVADLIDQELHCFEVSAIAKAVHDAMDADNLWPDVETMLPRAFLPSPTTWLEMSLDGKRWAWVLQKPEDEPFRMWWVLSSPELFSVEFCTFRARHLLEPGERIEIDIPDDLSENLLGEAYERGRKQGAASAIADHVDPTNRAQIEARINLLNFEVKRLDRGLGRARALKGLLPDNDLEATIKFGIAASVLILDLINTPGLIGLRQHDPHRGLARRLLSARSGSYPLQSWSEVVLKHETRIAEPGEHMTGATYHKCLHFVRSHLRHYRDGHVTVIPAHWRGDPALGIKRTRYRMAA